MLNSFERKNNFDERPTKKFFSLSSLLFLDNLMLFMIFLWEKNNCKILYFFCIRQKSLVWPHARNVGRKIYIFTGDVQGTTAELSPSRHGGWHPWPAAHTRPPFTGSALALQPTHFRAVERLIGLSVDWRISTIRFGPEPVFVNVYGAQEPIPRNRFRQPMQPGGPVRQIGLSYRPARLGIDSWAP